MTKVKRRGHKKSTAGCDICKKRHLKCDESRPSCVNCITQGRRCPYLDEEDVCSTSTTAVDHPLTSTDDKEGLQTEELHVNRASDPSIPVSRLGLPTADGDFTHIRLLQQWLTSTYRTFVFNSEHADIYGQITLDLALEFPFLLHGMLALSALHLALIDLPNQRVYLQLAGKLQHQALPAFNAMIPNLDERSILPAFLFSNITGVHQMCKCFLSSEEGFDAFLDTFIQCLAICRGVNVVLEGWWPILMLSKLQPILAISNQLRMEQDVERATPEFDKARELVDTMRSTNSSQATDIYLKSIAKLQWSFNVQRALDSPELNKSTSWAFAWPMNIPPEFSDLLALRRPEALVILAHYAPSLQTRQPCWAIGGAGKVLFEQINEHLGPRWSQWLAWPKQVTERSAISLQQS